MWLDRRSSTSVGTTDAAAETQAPSRARKVAHHAITDATHGVVEVKLRRKSKPRSVTVTEVRILSGVAVVVYLYLAWTLVGYFAWALPYMLIAAAMIWGGPHITLPLINSSSGVAISHWNPDAAFERVKHPAFHHLHAFDWKHEPRPRLCALYKRKMNPAIDGRLTVVIKQGPGDPVASIVEWKIQYSKRLTLVQARRISADFKRWLNDRLW